MERTVPRLATDEIELYLRTIYSLLRSTTEVQIRTLEEVHARVADHAAEAARRHVHAVDLPVGGLEDAFGQVVADEAVDAEDEDLFHAMDREG